ncbi:hypothetical protein HY449_02390 [Candidatus Pacearchaeota archaeon]|nr:hypothetical protein [Candidatus Pacearchaeota archaeon]
MTYKSPELVNKYLKITYDLAGLTPSRLDGLGFWTFSGLRKRVSNNFKSNPKSQKELESDIERLLTTINNDMGLRKFAANANSIWGDCIALIGSNSRLLIDQKEGLVYEWYEFHRDPPYDLEEIIKVTPENLRLGDYSPAELSLSTAYSVYNNQRKGRKGIAMHFESSDTKGIKVKKTPDTIIKKLGPV